MLRPPRRHTASTRRGAYTRRGAAFAPKSRLRSSMSELRKSGHVHHAGKCCAHPTSKTLSAQVVHLTTCSLHLLPITYRILQILPDLLYHGYRLWPPSPIIYQIAFSLRVEPPLLWEALCRFVARSLLP